MKKLIVLFGLTLIFNSTIFSAEQQQQQILQNQRNRMERRQNIAIALCFFWVAISSGDRMLRDIAKADLIYVFAHLIDELKDFIQPNRNAILDSINPNYLMVCCYLMLIKANYNYFFS